jgi:DNA-binding NtrC family response regulator
MRARILIVDDDPDIVLALENRVIWMGHEPLIARDGKEALRRIQEEQPDLVLLDVILPYLSGFEVLQQLNDAARSSSSTEAVSVHCPPVIIHTACGTIERAVKAKELGAVDFITKPFTGDDLTVVINKALETISLRRQVERLTKG